MPGGMQRISDCNSRRCPPSAPSHEN
jgi:hypothetical protein